MHYISICHRISKKQLASPSRRPLIENDQMNDFGDIKPKCFIASSDKISKTKAINTPKNKLTMFSGY